MAAFVILIGKKIYLVRKKVGESMATIQDIAEHAEVSSATVSRVINNNGYVGKETRAKVEAAIKQLNYTPNRHAQYLRKGATKNLGVISTRFNDTAMARINPFIHAAHEAGYTSTLFATNGNRERELEALDMLKSKQLDGIFLVYRANKWDVLKEYVQYGPVITLHNIESGVIPSVFIDHYEGYKRSLDYLWESGCRRIINLYSNENGRNTKRRVQAYQDFCSKHNLTPHETEPFINILSKEDAKEIVEWFAELENKPDAFIAHSDTLAGWVIALLKENGYRVPEDVSVMGFDNLEISELMDITTIDYGIEEQGKNACRLLLNELENNKHALNPLEFKLIKRGSTQ